MEHKPDTGPPVDTSIALCTGAQRPGSRLRRDSRRITPLGAPRSNSATVTPDEPISLAAVVQHDVTGSSRTQATEDIGRATTCPSTTRYQACVEDASDEDDDGTSGESAGLDAHLRQSLPDRQDYMPRSPHSTSAGHREFSHSDASALPRDCRCIACVAFRLTYEREAAVARRVYS